MDRYYIQQRHSGAETLWREHTGQTPGTENHGHLIRNYKTRDQIQTYIIFNVVFKDYYGKRRDKEIPIKIKFGGRMIYPRQIEKTSLAENKVRA